MSAPDRSVRRGGVWRLWWAGALFGSAVVLLAPIWILWSPGLSGLRSHAYRTLIYHQVVRRAIGARTTSEEEVIERLGEYVQDHMWVLAGADPYDGKPIDYLVHGTGWCDYQAGVYKALLGVLGIPARYAMLMTGPEVSSHTVTEVESGGRWGVYDTFFGVRFTDRAGKPVTLESLSASPGLLHEQAMMAALRQQLPEQAAYIEATYAKLFPMSFLPRRSSPGTKYVTFFDRVLMFCAAWGGQPFVDWYQDQYFRRAGLGRGSTAAALLQAARHWDLAGRTARARAAYRVAARDAGVASEARLWLGILQWERGGDARAAQRTFEALIKHEPRSPWVPVAWYYTGRCEESRGHGAQAKMWYVKAGNQNMLAACRRLAQQRGAPADVSQEQRLSRADLGPNKGAERP